MVGSYTAHNWVGGNTERKVMDILWDQNQSMETA